MIKSFSAHDNCIGCSQDGMLINDIDGLQKSNELKAVMLMDKKREGWIGLPHGGIGMGAVMELVSMLENYPADPEKLFPLKIEFRMGGASAKIGDAVLLRVWQKEGGAEGEISVNNAPHPYISAKIFYGEDDGDLKEAFHRYMPGSIDDMGQIKTDMPNYRDCFVCGLQRQEPGLKRRFQVLDKDRHLLAISHVGFKDSDQEDFFWCRRGKDLHPLGLLALLDETMGWGGFLLSGQGGVSVRFSFVFLRDIRIGEKIIAFGRGENMKGNIEKRLMFWSSGGIAAVDADGRFEMAAASSGQFLARPELTEQMKTNLFPEELTRNVFQMAGHPAS